MTNDKEFAEALTNAVIKNYPGVFKADPESVDGALSSISAVVAGIYASVIAIVGQEEEKRVARRFNRMVDDNLIFAIANLNAQLDELMKGRGKSGDHQN